MWRPKLKWEVSFFCSALVCFCHVGQQYVITSEAKYAIRSNYTVKNMSSCGGGQLKKRMAVQDTQFDLVICTRGQKNIADHYFFQDSILHKWQYKMVNDSLLLISHNQLRFDSVSVQYKMGSGFYEECGMEVQPTDTQRMFLCLWTIGWLAGFIMSPFLFTTKPSLTF